MGVSREMREKQRQPASGETLAFGLTREQRGYSDSADPRKEERQSEGKRRPLAR
jgi:hypothetical protein